MPTCTRTRLVKRLVDSMEAGSFRWDSELPGFGVRATPSGRRSFIIQYRTKTGVQGRTTIGSYPALTVEQARTIARETIRSVSEGRNPSLEKKKYRNQPVFNDLVNEYLVDYAQANNLRISTIRNTKIVLRLPIAIIGNRPIIEIGPSDIRKLQADMVRIGREKGTQGTNQANKMIVALSKMFNIAIENGWAQENPCRYVKLYPVAERWRNLSELEVSRLLQACDKDWDQNTCNAIRLLLFTGARTQEWLKAEWRQIDLERGVWVRQSHHTKTHRTHRIEFDGETKKLLKRMRSADPTSALVFPGKARKGINGEVVYRPRVDIKRCWKRLIADSKLEDVKPHDLRRTTASFMLSDGASLATVGKTLGHTQPSTTARYATLSMEVQRKALTASADRMKSLANIKM